MPKKPKLHANPSDTEPVANPVDAPKLPVGQPEDIAAIRKEISAFMRTIGENGKPIGRAPCGVYAFYDYDGEPIYIGQTYEGLGARIGRHLTNQRTDAVAMNVLDPFEVAEICVWPIELSHLAGEANKAAKKVVLDRAEYTLYCKVIEESSFKAVLNEKAPRAVELIKLPKCYRKRIIPDSIFPHRKHPDVRIARRASTIAALARVISERKVTKWLRTTLLTQARRLERLAAERLADFANTAEESEDELESKD